MSVDIVYETHMWSEDNERGIASGWLPGKLSARGRSEAAELGRRHRLDGTRVVYTSDLARAVETATIAFAWTGLPIIEDARLRECNYGLLNGAPVAQLDPERLRHLDVPFPEGESYHQVVERMARFLVDVSRQWDGARVVLIGHSAPRLALDHLLNGVPLADLVGAPFEWQPGWSYTLPSRYAGPTT